MMPIYLEFQHAGVPWSALLHADQGRCDLWRDLAWVGTATFSHGSGFSIQPAHLADALPVLVEQLRPYYPLLQHEGRQLATRSGRVRVAVGAS